MISIQMIHLEHPLYPQEQELRNKILLRPIGMPDHAWEMHDAKSWHFVATEDKTVVGCVVLNPLNENKTKAQLMQMAVETNQQGKGIGKLLVDKLIAFAKANNIQEIVCHARENAAPFYTRLGFQIYDDPFIEVGMKHYHMKIILAN